MSLPNDDTDRATFRFRTWRPARMTTSLRIDEALDTIGKKLYPKTWGRDPNFELLPLFYRSGRAKVYTLVPHGKTGFKRRDVEDPPQSAFTLTQEFRAARRLLRKAIRKGDILAVAVVREGRKRPLKDAELTVQSTSIFGAGTVKRDGHRSRVWLHRAEFNKWLAEAFREKRTLTNEEIDNCFARLAKVLGSGRMKSLSGKNIREFIQRWLAADPPNKVIDEIKERLKLKGGAPSPRQWKAALKDLLDESD